MCFTVEPVRQEIRRYRWKKSTKAFESKMRQSSLGINQISRALTAHVFILHFNRTYKPYLLCAGMRRVFTNIQIIIMRISIGIKILLLIIYDYPYDAFFI